MFANIRVGDVPETLRQDHRSVFSEARRIQGSCHAKMFEVRDEPVFTTAAMPTPQPGHAQSGSMPGIKYEQS